MTDHERGMRDAFVAMTKVFGYVPQHVVEAMTIAKANFFIPELEAVKESMSRHDAERDAWLATLPPDYDERRAV